MTLQQELEQFIDSLEQQKETGDWDFMTEEDWVAFSEMSSHSPDHMILENDLEN